MDVVGPTLEFLCGIWVVLVLIGMVFQSSLPVEQWRSLAFDIFHLHISAHLQPAGSSSSITMVNAENVLVTFFDFILGCRRRDRKNLVELGFSHHIWTAVDVDVC